MLRKEDSNKVLKGVKAVFFATSLSLLNPVNVEAMEVTSQQTQQESSELTTQKIYIGSFISFILGGVAVGIYTNRKLNKDSSIELIGTKLSDEDSKDNIEDAVKHLKLVNK